MFTKILKDLKTNLTSIAKTIGTVQSAILLGIFYYLILGPFALIYNLANTFSTQSKNKKSYWKKRNNPKPNQELLQKQY